ncbi:protein crumbs homolog 1 isoform X1 [Synchiropus splendidus]|uniref:protein crumbs homolog 1 isoform X1 n=1 Tax=Synchiropus splendidus TaxID=270530 RepID=UPI00237D65C1|nr:protein crumbs homolog 1 isoform X1 [Synchiropus splendidus]
MDFICFYSFKLLPCTFLFLSTIAIDGVSPENAVDLCSPNPCQNRALCRLRGGGYSCFCVPGFQGSHCQIDVNECVSQPCRNGGSCVDKVGQFSCLCPAGFTGATCQVQIEECHSAPCLNEGSCHDHSEGFTCTCRPGFQGQQCEINTDECQERPCQNGGLCVDGVNGYRCDCSNTGFTGLLCERPQPPCHSGPCFNNASCEDVQGSVCQEVINPCDPSPCQNEGHCEIQGSGYVCHCRKHGVLFGGSNCEVKLVGCDGHQCQNNGTCSPSFLDHVHFYTCSCSPGYTGNRCQTSTTFSFEQSGHLVLHSPLVVSCNLTLSFKTVLPSALLFQRIGGGAELTLALKDGWLRLSLRTNASDAADPILLLQILHNVSDGEWHSVAARLINQQLSLNLVGEVEKCGLRSCLEAALVPTYVKVDELQKTLIGGEVKKSTNSTQEPVPSFIGCMRDVVVDSELIVPEEWLNEAAFNVSPGCIHRDRCLDVPCHNQGQCINLWQSYECVCSRPYEGHDCDKEHVTARFGSGDAHSYATFKVTEDLGHDLSLSLFLRTQRSSGLLLVLANRIRQYMHMWLMDGRVVVQINSQKSLISQSAVNDGEVHFVKVELVKELVVLAVSDQQQVTTETHRIYVEEGDRVFVGGLLSEKGTAMFGGYFKGCIQDLRMNDGRLMFFGLDTSVKTFPLQLIKNVTAGCTGDDACSSNPCLNGGLCYSMWDDFTCECPPSATGQHCEEVMWCDLSPCPGEAECRMLNQGFECYANVTFLNESTVLTYRGNGQIVRNITNISLTLRTRKRNAAVLHAEKHLSFVTVSIQDGFLFMELQTTAGTDGVEDEGQRAVTAVSLRSKKSISDGDWHSVHLFMTAPWADTSRWTMVLDDETVEASTSKIQGGNLDFLRHEVDIFLGMLSPEAPWSLAGCVSTVELGGIALPYFTSSDVNLPRHQQEQFTMTSRNYPLLGCRGAPVCEPNPCLHGGECEDMFNSYNCHCADGWAGYQCNVFTDTCASSPCLHGNCSESGLTYKCTCEVGYTGADCKEEVDVCENHLCAHGGTCLHGPEGYACLCPENYTGPLCNERVAELPWYIPGKNVRPRLPVSVCGDNTRNYTCFNGGNCTERELSCDCPPGFIGHRCEQEVDECVSNPCLNGGYCRNLINKYLCVCDMSFAGDICQTDLSAEGLTSDPLLGITLVSVALLLVLGLTTTGLVVTLNRRATYGTYSPSRQEKEGSRVEMWSVTQPPLMERLI